MNHKNHLSENQSEFPPKPLVTIKQSFYDDDDAGDSAKPKSKEKMSLAQLFDYYRSQPDELDGIFFE